MVTIHIAQAIGAVVLLASVLMLVAWLATRAMVARIGELEGQLTEAQAAMDELRPVLVSALAGYSAPDWIAFEWEGYMCMGDTAVFEASLMFDALSIPEGQYRFRLVAEPLEQTDSEGADEEDTP